jgi:hypothetical protein
LSQGRLQVIVLDLLGDILDVTLDGLLVTLGNRDGLRPVVSLGVAAGSLPLRRLLGRGGSSSRGLGGLSGGGGGLCRCGSGLGGRASLGRRGGDLGERDNGAKGAGSSGSTAGPGHGLGRLSGRGGSRSLLAGGHRGRAGLGRLLRLLGVLLDDLADGLLGVGSGSGLDRGHGLGRSSGRLRNALDSVLAVDRSLLLDNHLLQLLVNNAGVESGDGSGLLDDGLRLFLRLLRELNGNGGSLLDGRLLRSRLGLLLLSLLVKVAEDVVQNEVARRLLGQNKGLNELLGVVALLVGRLADNLDDNVVE